LKGGGDVGSRVRAAASACVVASGLFLCGVGGALAFAEPSPSPAVPGDTHSTDVPGNGPKTDPDGTGGSKASTDNKGDTDTSKPGNGGNPDNGNCGNDGSNGNAQHCGGSSQSSPPIVTSSSKTTTETTKTTTETTKTTTETTPSTTTTTSPTTTGRTTSSEMSETTTPTTTTLPGLPAPGGGGGGGGAVGVPSGRPELPPEMQLPPAAEPSAIAAEPGIGAAAVDLPIQPITLPVIVAPALGLGGGGPAGSPALPLAPRAVSAEPLAGREPLPANVGSNVAVPAASYRIGYTEYLRNAGLSQVAALAVPGVTGMLVLTCAGGLLGYRQAKAGHAVHTSGTARFVN
jgi:hypothetical protein